MRYVEAKLKIQQRDETYRIYVTDALKVISESASKFAGGSYLTKSYNEIIEPQPQIEEVVQEDTRTAEQFAADMFKRALKKRKR